MSRIIDQSNKFIRDWEVEERGRDTKTNKIYEET